LWFSVGDRVTGIKWLDDALGSISRLPLSDLSDAVEAAALGRATLLRTEAALRLGDRQAAAAWLACAQLLFQNADDYVVKNLRRVERMTPNK
jgi:hypothetical protein